MQVFLEPATQRRGITLVVFYLFIFFIVQIAGTKNVLKSPNIQRHKLAEHKLVILDKVDKLS